jgi:hypothetical protein
VAVSVSVAVEDHLSVPQRVSPFSPTGALCDAWPGHHPSWIPNIHQVEGIQRIKQRT